MGSATRGFGWQGHEYAIALADGVADPRVGIVEDRLQTVDAGLAGTEDGCGQHAFVEEVVHREGCGREVKVGDACDAAILPDPLLGPTLTEAAKECATRLRVCECPHAERPPPRFRS